jgi:hypothetical protein
MYGLCCPLEQNGKGLFLSPTDYRNNYFISNNIERILEFYEGFGNREELIEWMRERPKGLPYVYEEEGDREIIAVIPTADFNGKLALTCREEVFKGVHIIFVESGVGNNYFNYAHNCNVGIMKTIEYNPKWVVVSNDDMVKKEEISVLREALRSIDPSKVGIVYFYPNTDYHSKEISVSTVRKIRSAVNPLLPYSRRKAFNILKKFKVKFFLSGDSFKDFIFFIRKFKFKNTISIKVYSAEMIKKFISRLGYFYDEMYVNCGEEGDLALRIQRSGWGGEVANFKIWPLIGSSFGNSDSRYLRDQVGNIYFSKKLEDEGYALQVLVTP